MAVTKMQDLINPQVMGDMINAKIEAQLKMTPYARVDTTLQGVAGDTKTIPMWGYIGDATNQGENTELTYSAMSASTTTFTIGKASKGVSITTEAINSGLGNPIGQAQSQLAKAIAGKVDSDVLNAALSASMVYDGTANVINYDGIVDAVGKFEDEEDGVEKVMFIHPKQETQLLKDNDFLSRDKFTGDVAVNGAIGKIAGCWVKKSNKVPMVDAVTAVTAVAGVYKYTISTKAAANDRLKIGDVEIVAGSTDWSLSTDSTTGNAAALVATLNASEDESVCHYTWSNTSGTLIATEDTGYEGKLGKLPIVVTKGVSGTLVVSDATTNDTAGVAKVDAVPALFKNPIIKMEANSAETEYTEDELPAITIFLKKDTTVTTDYNQTYDRHDIASYRYYGVAKTNDAKLVVAKFAQVAQA